MSFVSKNPRFRSMILTDLAAGSIANPPSGSHRLINREGTLSVKDSSGLETAIGAGGTVDRITQTAHGFVVGEMLYYTGSNYAKAKADAANTAEIVGMVSRVIDVNSFEITLEGKVTGLAGLVAGSVYFLSASTAGAITATEPNVLGQISLPLGVAISTSAFYVKSSRGAIVGGTNARTQITLSNTTSAQTVYTIPVGIEAGELTGWIYLDATSDLKFYVRAPFAKNGAGTDWNISPSFMGDTPPAGFSMGVTSAGLVQITMNPLPSGFVTGYINYAINAPAVGASFPLTVDSTSVAFSSIQAKDSSGINFKENGGTTIGNVSDDGAWTFGPSAGIGSSTHTINGRVNLPYVSAGETVRFGGGTTNAANRDWGIAINYDAYGEFSFRCSTAQEGNPFTAGSSFGKISNAGAWTLGPTSFTGIHRAYGELRFGIGYTEKDSVANGTTWTSTTSLNSDSTARLSILHVGAGSTVGNIGEYLVGRVGGANNGVFTLRSADFGGITYTVSIVGTNVRIVASGAAYFRISLTVIW